MEPSTSAGCHPRRRPRATTTAITPASTATTAPPAANQPARSHSRPGAAATTADGDTTPPPATTGPESSVNARYGFNSPRPYPALLAPPGAGSAVRRIRSEICNPLSRGNRSRNNAAVAATNGVAKLVPSTTVCPATGDNTVTGAPNAAMSTCRPGCEKSASRPSAPTAATPITPGKSAGYVTPGFGPSLPAAATTTTPASTASEIAASTRGSSATITNEMLMTSARPSRTAHRIPSANARALVCESRPDDASSISDFSLTFTGTIVAPGASPCTSVPPTGAPAMIPATAVPCPTQSSRPLDALYNGSRPTSTRPRNCGFRASTPESITATRTPAPVAKPASRAGPYTRNSAGCATVIDFAPAHGAAHTGPATGTTTPATTPATTATTDRTDPPPAPQRPAWMVPGDRLCPAHHGR